MSIDTGQQLEIVYTENLLTVTPIGGHTSMVIAKIEIMNHLVTIQVIVMCR